MSAQGHTDVKSKVTVDPRSGGRRRPPLDNPPASPHARRGGALALDQPGGNQERTGLGPDISRRIVRDYFHGPHVRYAAV